MEATGQFSPHLIHSNARSKFQFHPETILCYSRTPEIEPADHTPSESDQAFAEAHDFPHSSL